MKVKWIKNNVPSEEGWYWCKYKGTNGTVICPCTVMHFTKLGFVVRTARNDIYSSNNLKGWSVIWFGPRIEAPDA